MFLLKIQIFSTIFHVITVTFCRKNVFFSRHFRKVRRQIPQCFLFYLFLPREDLKLHSWHSWNSFIFCWFHQNHPHGKREKFHHYKKNDDFPYPIGEKLQTPILFTEINTEQAHDIGFPSLEATLLNAVRLSRICCHFGFAMATGGRKPAACSKMLISHLVNFGRNFPSSLLRSQNGLGTAWPGREPEVKRSEQEILLPLRIARTLVIYKFWWLRFAQSDLPRGRFLRADAVLAVGRSRCEGQLTRRQSG